MPLAPFSAKAKTFFQRDPSEDKFFTLLEGSVRSGKTWAMMVKILSLTFYKVRGQRVLIGNSKESIRRNVLVDLSTFVGKKNYRINMQSGQMWLYGVEWLVIGVSNEGSERAIRGMTAGIIVWDEVTQAPQNVFDMAMSRLSPEGCRFYGTTNPGTPYHYLLTDYLEHKDFSHRVERIKFNLEDNLSLSEETRDRFRSMFHGVFYQRNILGLWVIAEGAIYRDSLGDGVYFTDEDRPIGLLGSGGYVERFVPIDYGTANQTVFLDIIDDGTTYWVNDEWVWDSRKENLQKTDKQYADDLEEWLKDKRGAQVIIDPSAASFKAELTQRGIWHCNAVNDVMDGIRTVSSLLAQRKLRIHRKNCPNLDKQMQTYSWDEKAAKRGEEKPLKENDHGCFVAGTMIQTPQGERAVEDILAGDEVLTPLGRCRVVASSPRLAECISVGLIEGTREHPIFIQNRWIRLDTLRYNEECESSQSSTRESRFGDIQTPSSGLRETTSALTLSIFAKASQAFIAKCGRMLTVQFHPGITSTIRTRTPATTNCPTSSACHTSSTSPGIPKVKSSTLFNGHSFRRQQKNGMGRQMESHGTSATGMRVWPQSSAGERSHSIVRTAASALKHFLLVWLSTALTLASRLPGVNLAWTTSPSLARYVAGILSRTSIKNPNAAASHAPRNTGIKTVYSLKTEHGCYVANGLLVSNCDTIRYGMHTKAPEWRIAG